MAEEAYVAGGHAWLSHTHPHISVDRQTPVKTLLSHNFVCGR